MGPPGMSKPDSRWLGRNLAIQWVKSKFFYVKGFALRAARAELAGSHFPIDLLWMHQPSKVRHSPSARFPRVRSARAVLGTKA